METIYTAANAHTGYTIAVLSEVDEDGTRYLVSDEMGAHNWWDTEDEVLADVRDCLDNALETCEEYAAAVVGEAEAEAEAKYLIDITREFVEKAYTGLVEVFEN